MKVSALSVDLLGNRATVSFSGREGTQPQSITLSVPIDTPGNQPENKLQQIARDAAREALQAALIALEE